MPLPIYGRLASTDQSQALTYRAAPTSSTRITVACIRMAEEEQDVASYGSEKQGLLDPAWERQQRKVSALACKMCGTG